MEKLAIIACLVAALLIGGLFAYAVFPREVEVIKEVEKIVEKEVQVEVEKIVEKDYKAEALELCKEKFLEDKYDLDKYEEVVVRDISKEWSVSFNEKKDITKVLFDSLTFRVYNTLTEKKTDYDYTCEVVYKEDEDPKVKLNELA